MFHDLRNMLGKYPALKDAYDALQAKRQELKDIFDAAPKNDAGEPDLKAAGIADPAAELRNRNQEINDLHDAFEAKREECLALENASLAGVVIPAASGPERVAPQSIGDLFVASQAFQGYAQGAGVGPTADLDISFKEMLVYNTLFETGAGWDPEVTRTGRVELFATRPAPHVIDAIPQTTTKQSAIKYMEETTFTNDAAETAEGGLYKEATLALTEKSSPVEKVTVWLPVTDEQFEDEERSRDYVNNRLVFMLRQRVDSQALVGTGVAPNLRGTESVVGIQTQAKGTDPFFDAAYKAFRKIRDDGFAEPSAFFIRPDKWEGARLARTADGIYILGNPGDTAPVRLWGVPGIETTAAPATKLIAGDYRNFSELSARRGVNVQITNSHASDFINGKLAIRADVRAALVHYRPKAFAEVTGL